MKLEPSGLLLLMSNGMPSEPRLSPLHGVPGRIMECRPPTLLMGGYSEMTRPRRKEKNNGDEIKEKLLAATTAG